MSGLPRHDGSLDALDDPELDDGAHRVDDTLARISAALIAEQLKMAPGPARRASGADPYNTGVFRAPARGDAWGSKRPR